MTTQREYDAHDDYKSRWFDHREKEGRGGICLDDHCG